MEMTAQKIFEEVRRQDEVIYINNRGKCGGKRVYLGEAELEVLENFMKDTYAKLEISGRTTKKHQLMGMDIYVVKTDEPHIFVV